MKQLLHYWKTGKVPAKFNFSRDVFDLHVKSRPSSLALWFENDHKVQRKWTFSNLRDESIRSAIFLRNILNIPEKPEKSPYLITLLSRTPEWWFLHLAAIRTAAVFCPATTMLTTEDVEYRLDASRARMVITDPNNWKKVEESCKNLPDSYKRNLRKVLVIPEGVKAEVPPGWIDFGKLVSGISKQEVEAFRDSDTGSEEEAQAYFTSGTTGKPKMVAHTHSSYGIGHYTTVKILDLKEADLHWNISDPGWAKSSYSNFFAPWIAGSTVYIHQMERFEPRRVLQVLTESPITTFCAPPTLYKAILQEKDSSLFKFKNLRFCFGAGEAVNPGVAHQWKEKTGLELFQGYGQTEMTAIDCELSKKPDSVGIPNGFFDIRILDENLNELPPMGEGELALKVNPRPIGLFKGYLKKGEGDEGPVMDVEKNASVFRGDYYLTGDRGYKDETGHLFLNGRGDDVINSAGYRIGPTEIESVLQTHPAVVESAAVSSPDEKRGEVVKAFIILTEKFREKVDKEGPAELIKEIQNYVKLHTAPYKYPRKVEFVDGLPKTVSGKILRRELKRAELEKARAKGNID